MKKKDQAIGELLRLLKTHPELISALVFDPKSVQRLLKSKEARGLARGVSTREFLSKVVKSDKGGPIALCAQQTAALCGVATHCECFDDTSDTYFKHPKPKSWNPRKRETGRR